MIATVLHGFAADVFIIAVMLVLVVLVCAVIYGTLQGILDWLKRRMEP